MRSASKGAVVVDHTPAISIHALHAERVGRGHRGDHHQSRFQSTRSMRSASAACVPFRPFNIISIHALHAERVTGIPNWLWIPGYFNPRAPCGARRKGLRMLKNAFSFQSTRSMRSASMNNIVFNIVNIISIHALHAERVHKSQYQQNRLEDFNPRAPCGARRFSAVTAPPPFLISIHALHAERVNADPSVFSYKNLFQSTRSMRSASWNLSEPAECRNISIHALHAERVYTSYPQ